MTVLIVIKPLKWSFKGFGPRWFDCAPRLLWRRPLIRSSRKRARFNSRSCRSQIIVALRLSAQLHGSW